MALVDRLMHVEQPDMAGHTFWAAMVEVNAGRATVANVKAFFQMDAAAAAEFDALIAKAPGNATARLDYINSIHSVFILAEARAPGYDTPAGVRAKLGI